MNDDVVKAEKPITFLKDISGLNCVIPLYFQISHLKNVYRSGWLLKGREVPKELCESDADHTFGVAILSYLIADAYRPELNKEKVVGIALVHELGECCGKDCNIQDKEYALMERHIRERLVVCDIFKDFPDKDKYISLWDDFTNQRTKEGIFVKQIDRLEMGLQAKIYDLYGYNGTKEFLPWVKERLSDPDLIQIIDDISRIP